MKIKMIIDGVALTVILFSGINWGLVGIQNLNVVSRTFGRGSLPGKMIYLLIGASAAYLAVSSLLGLKRKKEVAQTTSSTSEAISE